MALLPIYKRGETRQRHSVENQAIKRQVNFKRLQATRRAFYGATYYKQLKENSTQFFGGKSLRLQSKMSLLPYFFDDFGYQRPRRLLDQHFGLALTPDDVLSIAAGPLLTREYYRPWRHLAAAAKDLGSSIKADGDKFQINLDVQHFAPEEISVKTADGFIVVEGKHEEKKDSHGYISRQFVRRYALPEGAAPETVESRLSSDGVLTITAPRKVPDAIKGERKVPISQTGPVRKEIKDQSNQSNGTEEKKEK